MEIIFKDGHKIEFKQFGNIWLAESVIWEETALNYGSLKELRKVKVETNKWFRKNAPEEIRKKYNARLPLLEEIIFLPFKDQLAYKEGRTDQVADYFVGDENGPVALRCGVAHSLGSRGRFYYREGFDWAITSAVRLCLEEK